jgi:hypothetical protein
MQRVNGLSDRKGRLFYLTLGILFLVLYSGNALAAGGANPCTDDAAKFCKDVKPGGAGLTKCLREHENELSQACKTYVTEGRKKAKAGHDACKADIDNFCKEVEPGGGRVIKCLRQHETELSAECKAGMPKARK